MKVPAMASIVMWVRRYHVTLAHFALWREGSPSAVYGPFFCEQMTNTDKPEQQC